MINIEPIGIVKNSFKEPADPFVMRKHESKIIIDPEFEEGLYRIEESVYIDITFHFHITIPHEKYVVNITEFTKKEEAL